MRRPLIFIFLFVFCCTIGLVEVLETGLGSVLRPDSSFCYYPDLKKRCASVPITSNRPLRLLMSDDRAQVSGSFIEKGLKWLLRKNVGKGGETFGGGDEGSLNGVLFLPPLKSVMEAVETDLVSSKSSSSILSQCKFCSEIGCERNGIDVAVWSESNYGSHYGSLVPTLGFSIWMLLSYVFTAQSHL